jgi:hypothetical protein
MHMPVPPEEGEEVSAIPTVPFPHDKKRNPFPGQVLRRVEEFDEYGETEDSRKIVTDLEQATVVTSEVDSSITLVGDSFSITHKPVLDIDMPVIVVPSSTPGHHHLFIDKEMSWDEYHRLLNVLAEVGIIEEGYLGAAVMREHTAVRLQGVTK